MPDLLPVLVCVLAYLGLAWFCWPVGGACRGLGRWPRVSRIAPLFPLALHAYLLAQGFGPDGVDLGFSASLSAVAALTVLFYSLAAWRYPLGGLHSMVLVLAGVLVALQAILPYRHLVPLAGNPAFHAHLLMAFVAYGLFTVAALHAALIAVAESQLHRPVPPRLVASLPPLLTLEALLFRMIELGFVILTLTLVSGMVFSESIYGRPFTFSHMTVFGLLSWLIFAALLTGRRIYGWRGKSAITWTLAGFVTLLLAYIGVQFVLEVLLHRA